MSYPIDPIDREIVTLLQEDGRMPCVEIARRMGNVTERVVRGRIKRLTEKGIVRVSAIINPERVGHAVIADVWIDVDADQIMEVGQKLTQLEQVSYVACSTGDQNISMQANAESLAELYRFVADVVGKIRGVKHTTIRIIPIILKDIHEWQIPSTAVSAGKEARPVRKRIPT